MIFFVLAGLLFVLIVSLIAGAATHEIDGDFRIGFFIVWLIVTAIAVFAGVAWTFVWLIEMGRASL